MKPHHEDTRELVAELRVRGWGYKRISRALGISQTTIRRWTDPEFDERARIDARERKKRYGGTCVDCGAPTKYAAKKGAGTKGSDRCPSCAWKRSRKWTKENVIAAIRTFAEVHGRPPSSTDWNHTLARKRPEGVLGGGDWPSTNTVRELFGSWRAGMEAAGFQALKPPNMGAPGRRYWTEERIIEALQAHSKDGVAPTQASWTYRAEDRPTLGWVQIVFGTWSKACHAAGLVTVAETMGRHPRPPRTFTYKRCQKGHRFKGRVCHTCFAQHRAARAHS